MNDQTTQPTPTKGSPRNLSRLAQERRAITLWRLYDKWYASLTDEQRSEFRALPRPEQISRLEQVTSQAQIGAR